eukprot:scaffold113774_cov32-Tisochrysis_lutea.AAC.1
MALTVLHGPTVACISRKTPELHAGGAKASRLCNKLDGAAAGLASIQHRGSKLSTRSVGGVVGSVGLRSCPATHAAKKASITWAMPLKLSGAALTTSMALRHRFGHGYFLILGKLAASNASPVDEHAGVGLRTSLIKSRIMVELSTTWAGSIDPKEHTR